MGNFQSIEKSLRYLKYRAYDTFNDYYYFSDNYANIASFFTSMQALINAKLK